MDSRSCQTHRIIWGLTNSHTENTDRQTDRQADRQTDRQTDRQADRQVDRQTDRQTDRNRDRERQRVCNADVLDSPVPSPAWIKLLNNSVTAADLILVVAW